MSSNRPQFSKQLLHPRLWVTWLWFALWWLITLLPYRVLLLIGAAFGLALYRLPTRRKQIALKNIEVCFANLDQQQQQAMLRANFISMGIALMEVGMGWWWSKKRLQRLVHYEGLDHLDALDQQAVILLAVHHTTVEIGVAALNSRIQLDGMYRAHKNLVYDFIQARGRLNQSVEGGEIFERNNVRGAMKSLKAGRKLWYLPDHDYGLEQSLFAPLFGVQAATVYTTARFAEKTKAAVVPVTCIRLEGSQGYQFTVHKPLEDFPTGDDLADATRINKKIEEMIILKPEQYLWAHRRFKNRPASEKDIYNF
jgi:KDO2-lipid IV(A) lauroyltransferase